MFLLRTVFLCFCVTNFIATPAEGRFGGLVKVFKKIGKFFKGVHHAIHYGGNVFQFMNENRQLKEDELNPEEKDIAKKLIDDEITGVVKDLIDTNLAESEEKEETTESDLKFQNPREFVNREREIKPIVSDPTQREMYF